MKDETNAAEGAAPGFASLGLDKRLLATLAGLGYEEPTPIQRAAIPPILEGLDVIGQAATGTGKTAAFALPLIQRAVERGRGRAQPSSLILVPTRELAMQVAEAVHRYGHALGVQALPIYGGQGYEQQLRGLKRGVDIVIATPGRALDHLNRGTLSLSKVMEVVLDEADEMLDMGFVEDIEAILKETPEERQVVLLSATMPPRVASIAKRYLKDPVKISIANERMAPGQMPLVRQRVYFVGRAQKKLALARLLDVEAPTSAIIFCRTRNEVDELTETLNAHGRGAEPLHGGMSQLQRERVVRRLKDGTTDLVVATDVAARGLDIDQLSHVINFDVPAAPAAYVHRIGRVGRAGREGSAITLAEPREQRLIRNIEDVTKQRIETARVPTVADLKARRMEMTLSAVRECLQAGDLDPVRRIVEVLAEEFDVMDVALAAVKLLHANASGPELSNEEIGEGRPGPSRGPRGSERSERSEREVPMGRIVLNFGRSAGIGPKDLVGAITGEANIRGHEIGNIDIGAKVTVVEIASSKVALVLEALRTTKIRGKKIDARAE